MLKNRARYAHEIMNQVKNKVYSDIIRMYKLNSCCNVRVEEWGTDLILLAKINNLHYASVAKARFEITYNVVRNLVLTSQ